MTKVIYLMGGLGNILYQLNLAFFLKDLNYKVVINTTLIENNWMTNIFGWKVHHQTRESMEVFIKNEFLIRNKPNIYFLLGFLKFKFCEDITKTKFFGHNFPKIKEIKKINHFFGYYQNTKYISYKIKDNLNKKYTPNISKETLFELKNPQNVVLHYRLGDKQNDSRFNTNFDKILKKYDFKKIFIVTDDKNSVSKIIQLLDCEYELVSNRIILDDFKIIQLSKNKILSRSSFSWWAAELSDKDGLIIEPAPFYKHVAWEPYSFQNRIKYYA